MYNIFNEVKKDCLSMMERDQFDVKREEETVYVDLPEIKCEIKTEAEEYDNIHEDNDSFHPINFIETKLEKEPIEDCENESQKEQKNTCNGSNAAYKVIRTDLDENYHTEEKRYLLGTSFVVEDEDPLSATTVTSKAQVEESQEILAEIYYGKKPLDKNKTIKRKSVPVGSDYIEEEADDSVEDKTADLLLSECNSSNLFDQISDTSFKQDVCSQSDILKNDSSGYKSIDTIFQESESNHIRQKHARLSVVKHANNEPFKCSMCGSYSGKCLHGSSTAVHSNEKPEELKISVEKHTHGNEKPYKCDLCNMGYNHKSGLYRHARSHYFGNSYMCNMCDKSFIDKSNLVRHKRSHTRKKLLKCHVSSQSDIKNDTIFHESEPNHIKQKNARLCVNEHTNKEPSKCGMCSCSGKCLHVNHTAGDSSEKPEEFNISVDRHTHDNEKPYKCDLCNMMFNYKSALNRHVRSHYIEKPFTCKICFKSFSQKFVLTKHIRTHTNEKPFKCNTCDMSFTQKSNVARHERSHTCEKPFKCHLCAMDFFRKDHLRRHIHVIHNKEKPFACAVCNKSFSNKYSLSVHTHTHNTNENLFKVVCTIHIVQ